MYSQDAQIRKLQEIELNMMKWVKKICEEENLTYFICGGTLIGAVRHKGFIPWDDDVDIVMPRKDYTKFIEIAKKYLPENIKVENFTDFKDKPIKPTMHHAQVIDLNTKIIRSWSNNSRQINVWVDLFPLDGMPNSAFGRELHYYHYMFWHMMQQFSWFDEIVNQSKPNRPFYEKIIMKFCQVTHFGRNFDTVKILEKIDKLLMKYDYDKYDYCADLKGSYRKKEILPRRYFEKSIQLPFEDTTFNAPFYYYDILTHFYGDYMTPPESAEEKEKHHRIEIISLDKETVE